jgi:adenylyltransferase/sulfurtransferase
MMMGNEKSYERYQRQLILKGFGEIAQDALLASRVLIIGAGGLGCPIVQYLVAAGVGHIGIADHDKVSLSNLHRQILFGTDDIGQFKVNVVKRKMHQLNPQVEIHVWREKWSHQHCVDHFSSYDLIVDATDNFASRYMINDAAVLLNKTVVFGAVSQYEGQVAVFHHLQKDEKRSVHYRDLFPEPPANGEVLNCSEAGVLGVLPGIVGSVQASEVIKLITGLGEPLSNKLWNYHALSQEVFILQLSHHPHADAKMPKTMEEFLATDYEWFCQVPQAHIKELDILEWKQNHSNDWLVDIREPYEQPRLNTWAQASGVDLLEIPLSALENNLPSLSGKNIVFICQAGRRSLQAASMMMQQNQASAVFSLKGGVNELIAKNLI